MSANSAVLPEEQMINQDKDGNYPSGNTRDYTRRWIRAKNAHALAEKRLSEALDELKASTAKLGAWLTPNDAKAFEKFNIWYGSGILTAEYRNEDGFAVYWRKQPDHLHLLREGA